eukprot:1935778-Prymnesium_polylepis.1
MGRRSKTRRTAAVSDSRPSTMSHATHNVAERLRPSTQCTSTAPSGAARTNSRKGGRCIGIIAWPSSSLASSASTARAGGSPAASYLRAHESTAARPRQLTCATTPDAPPVPEASAS